MEKTLILLNPKSGRAQSSRIIEDRCTQNPEALRLEKPETAEQSHTILRDWIQEGGRRVLIAGGDGTFHSVVNVLGLEELSQVELGLLPLGTGNDFCRTLGVQIDLEAALAEHHELKPRSLDLIHVSIPGQKARYCVNVITAGISEQIHASLEEEQKKAWGSLAYLRGFAQVLGEKPLYHGFFDFHEKTGSHAVDFISLIVGNGRTAGGGFPVSPNANPEDGLMDLTIIKNQSYWELLRTSSRLLSGEPESTDGAEFHRLKKMNFRVEPELGLSIDGELVFAKEATFEVKPGRLKVLVPGTYQARPINPTDLAYLSLQKEDASP